MKKFKKLKDKQKVLAVFGILGLVLILTGVTYAFFTYSKSGSTENTLKSGSITFWYEEVDKQGNGISIEDALPMSDADGKVQTKAFNFRITSTASSTTTIPYEITLRQKQGTDNIGDIVKVYLSKVDSLNNEEESELAVFNDLTTVEHNGYQEKLLHKDIAPASDEKYIQNYRLRMWIDGSVDFKGIENEETHELEYPYQNKTFTVMVNVYANGHVLTESSQVATVNSVSVGGNVLTPTIVNNIDTYEVKLPEGTASTTISVDTGDYDKVTITKTESDYTTPVAVANNITKLSNTVNKKVNLTEGTNYFKIVAISEDGNENKEIHIKIIVKKLVILQKAILDDNQTRYTNPTLTTSSNNTSNSSGLYSMSVTDGFGGQSGTGMTYYFRGNVTNNKVKFAGKDWRIIRINEDGTIRLILDNSTDTSNHVFNSNRNNYGYMYYSNSSAKNDVETWYSTNITSGDLTKVATGNYFCEAAKVKYQSWWTSGSATMALYNEYTPDLKCQTDGNNKGLLNNSVGLINYDEVVLAGGYYNSVNTSYYLYKNFYWWTMSPAGFSGEPNVFRVYNNGGLQYNTDSYSNRLRPVINLKADTVVTKDENGIYVVE